ncbi:unnamed protein product [Angiostrongylus costaricensis]|uniref:Uncharacterized protein n=1 Tax=Angiostrongylus costaricensis TaxID=334426 RepID=A0A0R3PAL2_ANGCS|nr:unnamed protein product [Angiostrongylus costaricensis]
MSINLAIKFHVPSTMTGPALSASDSPRRIGRRRHEADGRTGGCPSHRRRRPHSDVDEDSDGRARYSNVMESVNPRNIDSWKQRN